MWVVVALWLVGSLAFVLEWSSGGWAVIVSDVGKYRFFSGSGFPSEAFLSIMNRRLLKKRGLG